MMVRRGQAKKTRRHRLTLQKALVLASVSIVSWAFHGIGVILRRELREEFRSNRLPEFSITASELELAVAARPKKLITPLDTPTVVFYHIFIPEDNDKNVRRIVAEQVGQIGTSYASRLANQRNTTIEINYVTIGRADVINREFMDASCSAYSNLRCTHRMHMAQGFEDITLNEVRDFCTQHPLHLVTYIHSKGSYHPKKNNDIWRPFLTFAPVSEHCMNGMLNGSCNLCGLQFFAQWTPFIPGNMWIANCSYVRELLPPIGFSDRLLQVAKKALMMRLRGQVLMNSMPERIDFLGLGRYASEHWIASHPAVKPCDCDPVGKMIRFYHEPIAKFSDLSFGLAPRHPGIPSSFVREFKSWRKKSHDPDVYLREYFLVVGNLMKWFTLYRQAPNNASWAWTWYPGGAFWKEQTERWGEDVVDIVTRNYTSQLLQGPGAFVETEPKEREFGIVPTSANVGHGIFYNAYIPPDDDDATYREEIDFIFKQIALFDSMRKGQGRNSAVLFYRGMGHSGLRDENVCSNTTKVQCRNLGNEDAYYAGEALLDIEAFCRSSPTSKVSLIHNIPPQQMAAKSRGAKHLFLWHATLAVLDPRCSEVDPNQCNLCGLTFLTQPKFAMLGDMWTADCSYINRLFSPAVFHDKMNDFIADVLLLKFTAHLVMQNHKPHLDILGLDKFAMDHWVGSHPSLKPCDLSRESISYWYESKHSPESFSLRLANNKSGTPSGYEEWSEKDIRRREFSFLGGRIEKWYHLYGEVPDPSSWVWSWFPDGPWWINAVQKHGRNAVRLATADYIPTKLK